ncbi:hypothetical protein ACFL0D_01850 [Thermoproteota archaeon]
MISRITGITCRILVIRQVTQVWLLLQCLLTCSIVTVNLFKALLIGLYYAVEQGTTGLSTAC